MENNKPIKDWTLEECKEYCQTFRNEHGCPCKAFLKCILNRNGICNDWTHEWCFDKLTYEEKNIMQAVGAKFVTKVGSSDMVSLWKTEPMIKSNVLAEINVFAGGEYIGCIDERLFPSVHDGDCIEFED